VKAIKKFILLAGALGLIYQSIGQFQTIGTPFVRNYERSHYNAGFQNWAIEEGDNGMMYFANNDGLLEFNGLFWNIYPLPNKSIIRWIKKGNDHKLFAGGFNEIGYFELAPMGGAKYHSLTELISPEYRDFGEVWRIYSHSDGVVFQSFTQLMFLNKDSIKVIKAPSSFHFSFYVNGEYYINDMQKGLLRYSMGQLFPLVGTEKLRGIEIWSILPLRDKLLIATASDGVFLYNGNTLSSWNNATSALLENYQIYSVTKLNDGRLAFGTIQAGVFITDLDGKPIKQITRDDGLQNNTILCSHEDQFGNLWLGTDNGIDYVEINSPLSHLGYNFGLSTGYTAFKTNNRLYLGTNQGLYTRKWNELAGEYDENKQFELVEGTPGQVWSLNLLDNVLFCGHNNGTYTIEDDKATKICDIPGGWVYIKVPDDSLKIIGGTYSGLVLFEKQKDEWVFKKRIAGFSESSRKLVFDSDGTLWMTHGFKGVFHLFLNPNYDSVKKIDFYNSQNSPLIDYSVTTLKTKQGILFSSGDSMFYFNKSTRQFEPTDLFRKYFDNKPIRLIEEDKVGDFWYFAGSSAGVIRKQEDGSFNKIDLPFASLDGTFVKGFEFVYPLDKGHVFFATENGFVHYNPLIKKDYTQEIKAYLVNIQTYNPDSVLILNTNQSDYKAQLSFKNNSVMFSFSANDYENPDKLLFSTRLAGFEEQWTDWQSRWSKEFTNLKEGEYTFSVKAKNIYGVVSEPVSYSFKVSPPWHRSLAAYIVYAILVFGFLLLSYLWAKKRVEKAKKRSQQIQEELYRKKEEKLQRDNLEAEKEVIRLRNEKLREQMVMKDKELANATMQTLHKNKLMISIKNELGKIAGSVEATPKYQLQQMMRKINKEIDNENQWKIFETHFENVHEAFLTRIKTAYPSLTPRELKLCAYLRMNISSKEISLLMNISTRGVEISRYRLRKKFNLDREENLTDFILSF